MELGWYYREILALANRRLVSGPTAALVSELGARVRQLHGIVYEGNPYFYCNSFITPTREGTCGTIFSIFTEELLI